MRVVGVARMTPWSTPCSMSVESCPSADEKMASFGRNRTTNSGVCSNCSWYFFDESCWMWVRTWDAWRASRVSRSLSSSVSMASR